MGKDDARGEAMKTFPLSDEKRFGEALRILETERDRFKEEELIEVEIEKVPPSMYVYQAVEQMKKFVNDNLSPNELEKYKNEPLICFDNDKNE